VNVDFAGLSGGDNFASRQRVVAQTQKEVLNGSGIRTDDVERCFSTNFYMPLALFNAGVSGIQRNRLSIDTLGSRGHCGNCDWMMNLANYEQRSGFGRGKNYLVQCYAPGFFACGLLESCGAQSFAGPNGLTKL
jgi:3-oxoacyl-[acyl-carrier-protein] synthase III